MATHAATTYQTTLLKRETPAETAAAHAVRVTGRQTEYDSHEDVDDRILEDYNTDVSELEYTYPVNGTIADTKTWVVGPDDVVEDWYAAVIDEPPTDTPDAGQVDRAQYALDREVAKDSPQTTLVSWLEAIPGVSNPN